MKNYRYAIVIGASSGIGAELTRQLARNGCKVAAVARREDRLKELAAESANILPFVHDVTNYDEIPALFQEITHKLSGLDLVIYSSGVMPPVEASEFNFAKDRQMVEVNVLGAIAWLNQAAVRFEHTKQGTIVGIGSVAGDRGRHAQPVYNMTKAALATYLEALRNRLSRHGVTVVTIKPGPVETEMTASLGIKGAAVDKIARKILEVSKSSGEFYMSPALRAIFWAIKRVPSPIFRKLKV